MRILVLENTDGVAEPLTPILREHSIEPVFVPSIEHALSELSTDRLDGVVLDLSMPRIDGIDLMRVIRATPALDHLFVVVTVGGSVSATDYTVEWIRAHADAVLVKPYAPQGLLAAVLAAGVRRHFLQ